MWDVSVVLEWVVAIFLAPYMWTFALDFFAVPEKYGDDLKLLIRHWDEEGVIETPDTARLRGGRQQYIRLR
jgi:hypothetical protein